MSCYINSLFCSKELIFVLTIFICIARNNSESQPPYQVQPIHSNQSSSEKQQKDIMNNSKTLTIPLDTHSRTQGMLNTFDKSAPNSAIIEGESGGGRNSNNVSLAANSPINQLIDVTEVNKFDHTNGSKARKGVDQQPVPRKGVSNPPPISGHMENNPDPMLSPTNRAVIEQSSTVSSIPIETVVNKAFKQQSKTDSIERKKSEKPVFTYDDDSDNDDHRTLFKTSTNGQDYIIIGIAIVIGIWLSVFGALIFYRRAGEYWDRRHYRRMDFLVEGMYND